MNKMKVGKVRLRGKADLLWFKNEKPVLHLESENANDMNKIIDEVKKLGYLSIPYKIGLFQFLSSKLNKKTIYEIVQFIKKKKYLKNDCEWLVICDLWDQTDLEKVEYSYSDTKEGDVTKKYILKYYPLIGFILTSKKYEIKTTKIFELPFNKIGVDEENWTRLNDIT